MKGSMNYESKRGTADSTSSYQRSNNMKQVNAEAVLKLKRLVTEKKNSFVECRSFAEFDVVRSEMKKYAVSFENIVTAELPQYPFLIRYACGEPKEIIPCEEYSGMVLCPKISGIVTGELQGRHSWKFNDDSDIKMLKEKWNKRHNEKDFNPYIACYECEKPFADDDIPFMGFFSDEIGCRKYCICKECAYRISVKITEYEIRPDGTTETKEWKKGRSE